MITSLNEVKAITIDKPWCGFGWVRSLKGFLVLKNIYFSNYNTIDVNILK